MSPWEAFVRSLPANAKPQRKDPIQLVCFDLDGVLVEQESSWVTVHRHFGLDNEASLHAFLRGELSEEEFVRRDIALWRKAHPGFGQTQLEDILAKGLTAMPGAEDTVRVLRALRVECAIVSSGIEVGALAAAKRLGITRVSANRLHVDADGRLTGEGTVNTPLRDKSVPLRRYAKELGLDLGQVAAVGNSSPDIAMFRAAGVGIAFRPTDEFVGPAADHVVPGPSLTGILEPLLGTRAGP